MKKQLIFSLLVSCAFSWSSLQAADMKKINSINSFDQPESVLADPNGKMIYVSNIKGSPVELNGEGYISQLSSDGRVINKHWAKGFDAPKGLAVFKNKLYIADMQRLHIVNTDTGETLHSITASNSKMLNDVTVDRQGMVYVSDLLGGGIYRLKNNSLELWLNSTLLPHPNGVFIENDTLFIANWGTELQSDFSTKAPGIIYSLPLDSNDKKLTVISQPIGNLDGLAKHKGEFFVNDWITGNVFKLNKGKGELLFNAGKGAADISIDQDKLYVPMMMDNRVDIYRLN